MDPPLTSRLAYLAKSPPGTPAADRRRRTLLRYLWTVYFHMRCFRIDRIKKKLLYETRNASSTGVAVMVTINRGWGWGVCFAVNISGLGCSEASQPLDTATPWNLAGPVRARSDSCHREAALCNRLSEQHLRLFVRKQPRIRRSSTKPPR